MVDFIERGGSPSLSATHFPANRRVLVTREITPTLLSRTP